MGQKRTDCPEAAQLAEYSGKPLSPELAAHVDACPNCLADLLELGADGRFADDADELVPRGGGENAIAPAAGESDEEYEALVALLRDTGQGERYEIVGELGRGGMAVVYEVRDRVLRRSLAMKVARTSSRSRSNEASPTGRHLARFLEEARITGQLHHPSIISVHELGIDAEGRTFFTMTKVRGRTLTEVFGEHERGEGDWSLQRLVAILERACDALAYAHSKNVVHRDLKPGNIMVGRFGVVYVMDWGLAKVLVEGPPPPEEGDSLLWSTRELLDGESSSALTLAGEILGTPAYMPPEQARAGYEALDRRADVYSMGAILYRLLSGKRPYGDGAARRTPKEICSMLRTGPPTSLDQLAPAAPAELVAVCERAMAREPDERYDDMEGLTADLRAWLEGRVVSAYESGALVEFKKYCARNRALVRAVGLAVFLGLAAVLIFVVQFYKLKESGELSKELVRQMNKAAISSLGVYVDPASAFKIHEEYFRRTFGESSKEAIDAGHNLAIALLYLNRLEDAYATNSDVLERSRAFYGPEDPETLKTVRSHVSILVKSDRPEEAFQQAREAVRISETLYDDEAYERLQAEFCMASALEALGKFREALEIYDRVLETSRRTQDVEEGLTWTAMLSKAQVLRVMGDLEAAEELARQVVDQKNWPQAIEALAATLHARGKLEEARLEYDRALQEHLRPYEPRHPRVVETMCRLAQVSFDLGDKDEAKRLAEEASSLARDENSNAWSSVRKELEDLFEQLDR